MSVLARNRRQAATEFEMNCARLVVLTTQRADRIPARYKKFVRSRLMELTTSAYHAAIMANEADGRTDAGRAERRKLFERSIRYLTALQKPLVVYWSLFDSKEGGIREWADLVNKELALLHGAGPVPCLQGLPTPGCRPLWNRTGSSTQPAAFAARLNIGWSARTAFAVQRGPHPSSHRPHLP